MSNYSDDWDSDYSDDWTSDCADDWESVSKEAPKSTKVLTQKESRDDLQTDLEKRPKSTNAVQQQERRSDLKADMKESPKPTNVREQSQFETNSSNDNICLVPSDPNAFKPLFCQQRQAAIDNMTYRRAVDSWKARSIHDVVKLILELSLGKSLIDRAWIVFYWVSQNIEYDIESYFSGNIRHQTTEDVFNNRKGVCDAFGTIFEALCNGVQLECKKINGYAKGYGFKQEKPAFNRTNHAWNAVHIDGHWYLVDPTWGEGHINNQNQNVKLLSSFYFLSRPEQMIYKHLPENSQWQLLKSPISMKEFICLPYVESSYFEFGLHLVYPSQSNTASFNSSQQLAEVLLRTPHDIVCTASIQHAGCKNNEANTLVQYDADRQLWQCLFAPQRGGFHTLQIFARQVTQMSTNSINDEKSYSCVAQFGLQVPADFNGRKTFPIIYSTFSEHKCQILRPLDGSLKAGTKVTVQCRIPGAYCVRLILDGNWLSEDILKNDIFKREFTVPKREIGIYVKFSNKKNSSSYSGLYKYSVH
ncbi:unnamed protein product [Rotaria sp. Silwood2]|nr:unnamed protein product [Rotaria sp. Silwood2]